MILSDFPMCWKMDPTGAHMYSFSNALENLQILGSVFQHIGKSIANYFSNCRGFKTLLPSKAELDVLNLVECRRFLKDKRPDCVVHCVVNYNSMKETLIAYFNIVSCKPNYDKLVYFGSGAEYNPKRYKPLSVCVKQACTRTIR